MQVGDYVRTKNKAPFEPSQIAKITDMKKDEGYNNQYFITLDHNLPTTYNFHIYSEDVIKSSPNIIDLIEVGDYVNGYLVKGKTNDEVIVDYYCYSKELCDGHYLHWHKDLIETIVTKEQFESMEYRIEE